MLQRFKTTMTMMMSSTSTSSSSSMSSLYIAVILWYLLGVISISTSKLLLSFTIIPLSTSESTNTTKTQLLLINPIMLTFQQFLIGMTLLRIIMYIKQQQRQNQKPGEHTNINVNDTNINQTSPLNNKKKNSDIIDDVDDDVEENNNNHNHNHDMLRPYPSSSTNHNSDFISYINDSIITIIRRRVQQHHSNKKNVRRKGHYPRIKMGQQQQKHDDFLVLIKIIIIVCYNKMKYLIWYSISYCYYYWNNNINIKNLQIKNKKSNSNNNNVIINGENAADSNLNNHNNNNISMKIIPLLSYELLLCSMYFCIGFYMTNVSFSGSSASFVETIKSAEPFTSAVISVSYGLETLSYQQTLSLLCIIIGVLFSTMASHTNSTTPTSPGTNNSMSIHHHNDNNIHDQYDSRVLLLHHNDHHHNDHNTVITSFYQLLLAKLNIYQYFTPTIISCIIVMISNICFSLRGLYQKLYAKSTTISTISTISTSTKTNANNALDDINIQYRFQQMGVLLFILPIIFIHIPNQIRIIMSSSFDYQIIYHYIILSIINGICFTLYNLCSTYILTRISVIQHAILNCIRRIFAIIVTSIYFHVAITSYHVIGIIMSINGFLSFTYYKIQKDKKQLQQLSSFPSPSSTSQTNPLLSSVRSNQQENKELTLIDNNNINHHHHHHHHHSNGSSSSSLLSPSKNSSMVELTKPISSSYIPLPNLELSSSENNMMTPSSSLLSRTIPYATTPTNTNGSMSSPNTSRRRKTTIHNNYNHMDTIL